MKKNSPHVPYKYLARENSFQAEFAPTNPSSDNHTVGFSSGIHDFTKQLGMKFAFLESIMVTYTKNS
jgi:hypothetical protein